MLVNYLNLYYSITNGHALLAPALQTARQIKFDGNSIRFILLNRFESSRIEYSQF